MAGDGNVKRIKETSRRLDGWMQERRSRPQGVLPEAGQLRDISHWLDEAAAALEQLSEAQRKEPGTQADVAEYKQRLGELQTLLREMETQARMRRVELYGATEQKKAIAEWAKRVRAIG